MNSSRSASSATSECEASIGSACRCARKAERSARWLSRATRETLPTPSTDKDLLTFVASHVGSALSRAGRSRRRASASAELALVNDVQRGLAERLDMQAMYDLVGDRIQEIFDAQVVDIGIVDASSGLIHFPYTIERGRSLPRRADAGSSASRRVALETREPVVVNEDIERTSTEAGQPFVIAGEPPKSSVFVPARRR